MAIDREWLLLNRILTSDNLTGDEALALLRWMLLPDDEVDKEEKEDENGVFIE